MAIPLDFLPRSLRKTLMKFQKDGIRFAIEKEGRCLIGDEMGLGKTLQALSIAFYYKHQWPLLIIVPASMRLPWVDEIEKWFPEIQPEEINLIKNSADIAALSTAKINIVSYGLMSFAGGNFANGLLNSMEKVNFGVAILDESHFVKNRQATRTKRIEKLLKKIKRVILLTGTPSLARPEELYVQINIIRPGILGDWRSFGQRYCDGRMILQPCKGGRTIQKFDTRGASNLQELHEILKENLMIRRLKKDVLTQLPAKRRQRIRFEIAGDSANKKELDKSMEEFKKVITGLKYQFSERTKDKLISTNDVNGAVTRLFMATGLAKAGAIQQYIENLLDGMENKFIVFCFHLAVINAVTEILAKRHVKYVRLAGDVPPDLRASHVREFQTDPKCRVAVLSITASCTGLTLTAADHVVFAELHWTPGIIQQAEDRCHRIGQQNAVQIHYLVAKGTFDDVLWNMLSKKITVTSEALDGKTRMLTADEADRDKTDLLSMCRAWIPEDDDEEADSNASYLFTPKTGKQASNNQRDIRSSFALSSHKNQGDRKKRKVSKYYEAGLVSISDSSDDNEDFKANYKATKRRKKLGDCDGEGKESKKSGLEAIEENSTLSSKNIVGTSKSIMGNSQRTLGADDAAIEEEKKFGSKWTMGACSSRDLEADEEGDGLSSKSIIGGSEMCVGVDDSCKERISLPAADGVRAGDSISQSAELGSLRRRFGEEGNTRDKSKSSKSCKTLQNSFSASVVPEFVPVRQTTSKGTPCCIGTNELAGSNCSTFNKEVTLEAPQSIWSEAVVKQDTDSEMKESVSNTPVKTRVGEPRSVREDIGQDKLGFDDYKEVVKEDVSAFEDKEFSNGARRAVYQTSSSCSMDIVEASPQSSHNSSFSSIESGSGGMEVENAVGWNCTCCTFLNHADLKFCEMCETKRPSMFTRIKERKRARQRRSRCACGCTESKDDVSEKRCSPVIESGRKDGGVSHSCAFDGVRLGSRADESGECAHKAVLKRFPTDKNSVNYLTTTINSATTKHLDTGSPIPDNGSAKEGSSESESLHPTEFIISNDEPVQKGSSSADGNVKDAKDDEFVREIAEDFVSTEKQCLTDGHKLLEKSRLQPPNEHFHEITVIQESDCTITDSDDDDSLLQQSSFWQRNSGFGLLNASESEASTIRCRDDVMKCRSDTNRSKFSTEVKPASTDLDIHHKPDMQTTQSSPGISESRSENSNVLTEIQQFDDIDMVDDSWNDIETSNLLTAPKSKYNSLGFKSASLLYAEERKSPKMDTSFPTSENDVVGDNRDDSSVCSDKALRQTGTSLKDENLKSSVVLDVNATRSLNDSFKSSCGDENNDNDLEDFFKDDDYDDGFLGDGFDSDISVLSSEKSDYGSEEEEEVEAIDLQYKLSFESDRVYLYDEDDGALNINFQIPEMGFLDPEELPAIFRHPHNMTQLKAFCREWRSLTVTKQRMVRKAGKIFKSPTQLYQELREIRSNPSKERFTSKQKRNEKVLTIADMIGGKVTEISKPQNKKPAKKNDNINADRSSKDKVGISSEEENASPNLLQAIDADGNPICLFCNNPVKNGFKPGSHEAKFCSSSCKEEYQFRCSRKSVRPRLFELQKGVCQLCQLDTYELFQRIKALRKKDRRAVLETTHFTSLPANVLNNIILAPKEGLFWEADHIHAVSEGGGECGLDNYRTLCTPCHRDVTKDLMKRLRHQRKIDKSKAEGNADIQEFFRPAKEATVSSAQKRSKSVVDGDLKTNGYQHNKQDDSRKNLPIAGTTEAKTSLKVKANSLTTQQIKDNVYKMSFGDPVANVVSGTSKVSKPSRNTKNRKACQSSDFHTVSKASRGKETEETPTAFSYSDASETSVASRGSVDHEAFKEPRFSHTGEASETSKVRNEPTKERRCSSKARDAIKPSIVSKDSGSRESSAETCRKSKVTTNGSQRPSQTNRNAASMSTANHSKTENSAQKSKEGNSGLNRKTNGKAKNQTQPETGEFSFARMAAGSSQDIKQADDCIAKLIAKSTKSRNTRK